jgi:hypothetical protein
MAGAAATSATISRDRLGGVLATDMSIFPANQIRTGRLSPVRAIVFVVIFAIIFAIMAVNYVNWSKIDDQYHHARGCVNTGGPIDPSLPACTVVPYTVTRQYTHVSSSGRSSTTHYMLDVQSQSDNRSVDVEDYDIWNGIQPGSTIKLQLWEGKSRLVYANGQVAATSNNPDYHVRGGKTMLILFAIPEVLALAFLGLTLSRQVPRQATGGSLSWYSQSLSAPPPMANLPQSVANGQSQINGIGDSVPATVAGAWRGSWGSSGVQSRAFEAFLEVNSAGVIKGRFTEQGQVAEFTVAGEQEGSDLRFFKRSLRQGATDGVEFQGRIEPDGRSLYGTWHRVGRVLGIPFKTAGNWSATRVADPNVAAPMQQ